MVRDRGRLEKLYRHIQTNLHHWSKSPCTATVDLFVFTTMQPSVVVAIEDCWLDTMAVESLLLRCVDDSAVVLSSSFGTLSECFSASSTEIQLLLSISDEEMEDSEKDAACPSDKASEAVRDRRVQWCGFFLSHFFIRFRVADNGVLGAASDGGALLDRCTAVVSIANRDGRCPFSMVAVGSVAADDGKPS